MSVEYEVPPSTIPECIYKCAEMNATAAVFDAEKAIYTYANIIKEMETLAAGLLSTGLRSQDRVLICGSNTAHFFISTLACARADLIFSLLNPNLANAEQLKYALIKGEFRAIICFPANREVEFLNNLLSEISPELLRSVKGRLYSKAIPKLTHVIMAEEDHRHAGTFTLSEVYGRSNREKIDKLPDFTQWSPHKIAALQFTSGISAPAKLVALTHYQLINSCRAVSQATGCNNNSDAPLVSLELIYLRSRKCSVSKILVKDRPILDGSKSCICCALPLFKIPIFAFVGLLPFISHTRVIYPSPSPIPKFLFDSVKKYQCTHLVSNAVALGLILRIAQTQNIRLPSIESVILLGERVPVDVIDNISKQFENVNKVMNGYMLTEVASVPIMSTGLLNMKGIGKPLTDFEVDVRNLCIPMKCSHENAKIGELWVKVIKGSKFLGYNPPYEASEEWIETGDVVTVDNVGSLELLANKEDLILNSSGELIEHWSIEKVLCSHNEIKGAQIVALDKKLPLYAFIVPKSPKSVEKVDQILTDLISLCKNNKLIVPEKFAVVDDFPRINTKIQKYRMRQMLEKGEISMKP
ncbi:unnamed protein product [Thelazia callipaeda]|uniref:AMP-binding domain-containing protein n=1 Tax=Thelazia callipaeda TaxID=103827 RepID=A0A158RCK3_THECL|nr:unnamed protein product [Thelazia callipaeda]